MTAPAPGVYIAKSDGFWWSGNTQGPSWQAAAKTGFALVLDEQFTDASVNPRWHVYNEATDGHFGGTTRIQKYSPANAVTGVGTAGATNGRSLKLTTLETDNGASGTMPSGGDAGTRYTYTAGMLDSRTASVWYPRYGYYEWRLKTPHAQGLWPSMWLTAAQDAKAGCCEIDVFEYFHAEIPGKNSSTIHSKDNAGSFKPNRYTNNGAAGNGVGGRTFFEAPTYTPGWHTWAVEIVPVTDATGNTLASPTAPSSYVRITVFLDGVQAWRIVDTQALYWTTNGGTADQFWNIFMQGCQVDGDYIGHPRDTLGYSHWAPPVVTSGPKCLISGSPGTCSTTSGSYSIQRAQFDGVANVIEIDYVRVWKFTG